MGTDNYHNPPAWRAFMALRVNAVRNEIQGLGTLLSALFLAYMVSLYSKPVAMLLAVAIFLFSAINGWVNQRHQRKQVAHISSDKTLDL